MSSGERQGLEADHPPPNVSAPRPPFLHGLVLNEVQGQFTSKLIHEGNRFLKRQFSERHFT